jgi:hypothetical protein
MPIGLTAELLSFFGTFRRKHPLGLGERQLQRRIPARPKTQITFVSSLTPEDESRLAAALLDAMGGLLDLLPIAYSIRIETAAGKRLDRTRSPQDAHTAISDQRSAISGAPSAPSPSDVVTSLHLVDRGRPADSPAILPDALPHT